MTWPVKHRKIVSLGGLIELFVIFLISTCGLSATAFGQNDVWLGGTGLWSTTSQWSTGALPTSSSTVLIDNGNAAHSVVTINFNGAQAGNLTIDGDDNLNMVDGTIFTLYGPTINNSGSITLNSAGFGTYFNFGGAVTLNGTGTLTMGANSANYLMGYAQPSPGASLTNNSTIQGAGQIGFNGGIGAGNSFINQGTLNANQSSTPFTLNAGSGTITNKRTLEATNGATLALYGGTITNTGGTIHADPGSTVSLQSGITITGGTFTTSGTGAIQSTCCFNDGTLNGVTNSGTFDVIQTIEFLQGTITNNGSIVLTASGANTDLDVVGAVTLKGTGTVTMSNDVNNHIMGYAQAGPGASLTTQIPIQGAGTIGWNDNIGAGNTFTNQSTINSNQSAGLVIGAGSGTFINNGTMEATNGSMLALNGGTITNAGGTIHADTGSTVSLQSGVTINGGTFTTSGTGKIQSTCCFNDGTLNGVINEGTFQLIQTIEYVQGTITNNGSFQLNAAGANTDLDINGAVTLQGTGALTLSNDLNNHIMGYGQGAGSLLNQSTIQGAGTFGWNDSIGAGNTLTNDVKGTIYANQKNSLSIGVSSGSFTNNGTLKVKTGSALYISGGGFTNFSGGTGTLTGGKYLVSGTLGFDGAAIGINAANIALTGTKAAILNDLTNANALSGLEDNTAAGSFSLMSGAALSTAAPNFTNAGTLKIGAKSSLQIPNGPFTQTGGATTVDGTLTVPNGTTITSGSLFGAGTIVSTIQSSGPVTTGDSTAKAGTLSVTGTYTQAKAGSLNVPITGLTLGSQYGQLAVTNGVSLNGTLNIKLKKGFVPAVGDTFTILTGSTISGTFSKVTGTTINGSEHFVVNYNSTNVTLAVE